MVVTYPVKLSFNHTLEPFQTAIPQKPLIDKNCGGSSNPQLSPEPDILIDSCHQFEILHVFFELLEIQTQL